MLQGHDPLGALRPLHLPPTNFAGGSDLFIAIAIGFAAALLATELRTIAKRRRHSIRRKQAFDALNFRAPSFSIAVGLPARLLRDIVRKLHGDVLGRSTFRRCSGFSTWTPRSEPIFS